MTESIPLPFMVELQDELSIWRYNSFYSKEPETLQWLEYVANYKLFPNLIDVGSNIGLYSMYLLYLSNKAKVISVEPFEKNVTLQKLNLSLNGFSSRVELITNPVSNLDCLGYELVNDLRPAGSGYKLIEIGEEPRKSKLVRVKTLDSILKHENRTFGLKIDTDGNDFKVLLGADNSLRHGLIDTILIEASELLHEKIQHYLQKFGLVNDSRFNNLALHSDHRRKSQNKLERNRVYTKESLLI